MKLQGQQCGYAMVVLIVGLSIMAVLMTAAMPVWKHMAQREKEAELVFRGEQYARAIGLFQRKNGPGTLPPSFDLLVEQRFLRKKFKDPITDDEFVPVALSAGSATPGQTTPPTGTPPGGGGRGIAPAGAGAAPPSPGARTTWSSSDSSFTNPTESSSAPARPVQVRPPRSTPLCAS